MASVWRYSWFSGTVDFPGLVNAEPTCGRYLAANDIHTDNASDQPDLVVPRDMDMPDGWKKS
jgi:hypothetical protein